MDIDTIKSILACEIECSVFEKHVLPALEVVRAAAAKPVSVATAPTAAVDDLTTEQKKRIAQIVHTDCTLMPGATFYNAAEFAIKATLARVQSAARASMPERKAVTVTAEGVQFGNAWFSHEKITGYSADQLNSGDCHITGRAYMAWLQNALAAAPATPAAQGATLTDAVRMLEGYADSYDLMARMDDPNGNGTVQCRSVAYDIRNNMAGWIKKRLAAPTPVAAAQGATLTDETN